MKVRKLLRLEKNGVKSRVVQGSEYAKEILEEIGVTNYDENVINMVTEYMRCKTIIIFQITLLIYLRKQKGRYHK